MMRNICAAILTVMLLLAGGFTLSSGLIAPSVVVAAGKAETPGHSVTIKAPATFTIAPAPIQTVSDEALKLSTDKPAGFAKGIVFAPLDLLLLQGVPDRLRHNLRRLEVRPGPRPWAPEKPDGESCRRRGLAGSRAPPICGTCISANDQVCGLCRNDRVFRTCRSGLLRDCSTLIQ